MTRVLIVEDDASMATALRDGFTFEGYQATVARDGVAALKVILTDPPDLVVLDVMLPKMSGLDVCKEVRAAGKDLPIIMLTARGQEIDKVMGLKLGADDYMTKPFSFMELLARVEAVRRRADRGAPPTVQVGDVTIDRARGIVTKRGKRVDLSPREQRLLDFLTDHRGEVVPRERLLGAVWGYEDAPVTRTVDVHVGKLRRKLEDDPTDPRIIVTVHRLGYRLEG